MSRQIAHRGPDDATIYSSGPFTAAFRRLAIVGGQSGQQPHLSEDGSVAVLANAEIYNHEELRGRLRNHNLQSSSDTAVLPHLFENFDCELFRLLNGMFAIVVWDRRSQRLILAVDRFGIKPLYYFASANGLLFASELKGLLAVPWCSNEINWQDWEAIVSRRLPTFIKGIELLSGGSVASVHAGTLQPIVRQYWSIVDEFLEAESSSAVERQ